MHADMHISVVEECLLYISPCLVGATFLLTMHGNKLQNMSVSLVATLQHFILRRLQIVASLGGDSPKAELTCRGAMSSSSLAQEHHF